MARRQLPREITKIQVRDRETGKTVVKYQLRLDAGENPTTGERQQVKRRFKTEREARAALAEIIDKAQKGKFVARKALTVDQLCMDYMIGQHNLRPTSRSKLEYDLGPLRERHGDLPVQRLTKAHLDSLVTSLVAGGSKTAKGRARRAWGAVSVNKAIDAWSMVLADAEKQGLVNRNVGQYVEHVAVPFKEQDSYTEEEVGQILASITGDRLAHAWELALWGFRRGEIAGLKWSAVDLETGTLSIVNNRVSAGGTTVEGDPKSEKSRRTLPLPGRLVTVLKAAKARQAAERLALGRDGGAWEYVVSNEVGEPYAPGVLSRYWNRMLKDAGVRHIKLHGGRHSCATLMTLKGVPAVVIAEWIGHTDPSLIHKVYAHSQDAALKAAAQSFEQIVSPTCQ